MQLMMNAETAMCFYTIIFISNIDLHDWDTLTLHLTFFNLYAFSRCFYPKRLAVHLGYTFFCQYVCSLGIQPITFWAANAMLYHWATGTQNSIPDKQLRVLFS